MTTLEKLFVQIFERKDWIIQQVQQQADAYTQQLASKLLIDGITPPPWLLSPNSDSHSSDPKDLKKEEIISKLLLRYPRDSVPYSGGGCSLYQKLVVTRHNGRLSNGTCMEVHASNKGLDAINGPTAVLECCDNDVGCSLNCVPEQDTSVNSPQDETDARISDIYAAPDQSLVRIHRSKSRQKALELRTNVKTAAKSCLSDENRSRISFSGNLTSKNDSHQVAQGKHPSELDNHITGANHVEVEEGKLEKVNDTIRYSGRLTRSICSYEKSSILNNNPKVGGLSDKGKLDGGNLVQPTINSLQQSDHIDGLMEDLPDVTCGSHGARESLTGKICDALKGSKVYSGRITRSRSQQTSGLNKSSEPGACSHNTKECSGALTHLAGNLMQRLDDSSKLLELCEPSCDPTDRITETQVTCSNEGLLQPVNRSHIAAPRVSLSMSGATKESPLAKSRNDCEGQPIPSFPNTDSNQDRNAVIGEEYMPTIGPVAAKPLHSGSNLDNVTLRTESGGLALRQSSDCCMVVKPKQLDFDDMGECDLNEIHGLHLKKRKLDRCFPPEEPAASLNHKSSSSFFEQQSPLGNDLSSKPKDAWKLHNDNSNECVEDEIVNIGSNYNEDPVVENVQNNSEAPLHDNSVTCEVDTIPSDSRHNSDGKQHLIKEYQSLLKPHILEGNVDYQENTSSSVVYMPEAKDSESDSIPNLTKQVNEDSQDQFEEVKIQEPVELLGEDLYFAKSKDSEVGRKLSLFTMKYNSAEVNTWPQNKHRKVEDQPRPASRSFGVQLHWNIQRNTVINDLEAVENGLGSASKDESVPLSGERDLLRSNANVSCQEGAHQVIMCNLTEQTESLHEPKAVEAIVPVVYDKTALTPDMLKQSAPTCVLNMTKNVADDSSLVEDMGTVMSTPEVGDPMSRFPEIDYQRLLQYEDAVGMASIDSMNCERNLPERRSHPGKDDLLSYCSVGFPCNEDETMIDPDNAMPMIEGFIIDEQTENARLGNVGSGMNLETLELPSTAIERASILEQICKSASKQTPLSQFSSVFKLHRTQYFYQSVPTGLLEHMDLRSNVSLDGDSSKRLRASHSCSSEVNSAFPALPNSDWHPFSGTPFDWHSKSLSSPPVGKLWERSASSSGSSGKQWSSNPELTCFPIEEDPTSNEENENAEEGADEIQEDDVSRVANDLSEREPHAEFTEVCFENANSVSEALNIPDRGSLNSVNTNVSLPGTHNKIKRKPKNHCSTNLNRYEGKENQASSYVTRASSRGNASLHSEYRKPNQSNMRNGALRLSQKEAKCNNIISNITSFIPIVQQKQAAAICTGKRDIKVKALEAAEAAKRREEEKENERKMKKEALKLERARIEKEIAREMELNKKRKLEEQKKKEADMAARKRQREEDVRKEKAKKRKHVAETRNEQKLKYEKSRAGKVEKKKPCDKNDEIADSRKELENATQSQRQKGSADENSFGRYETGLRANRDIASDVQQVTSVLGDHAASSNCREKEKAISMSGKSPEKLMMLTSQEKSYEISPYQCSDDEDEEEDDMPTKKFIPSWASRNSVALVLPLQQSVDPETIFALEGFCSMDEVLLPRRLQSK